MTRLFGLGPLMETVAIFRASRLARLFPSRCVPTSDRMEIKPQWEPGPDIRVVDTKLCQDRWMVKADASVEARCPGCGMWSQRRHSAYVLRIQDLPVQRTTVELQVSVTRWRCGNRLCERKTFVGQPDQVIIPRARQVVASFAGSVTLLYCMR
jgi:hypothetical protein